MCDCIKNIINFFSHPLITGLTLFFVAKLFWIDKFLVSNKVSKDLKIKEKIISRILLLEEKIKLSRIYYNRVVHTVELIKKENIGKESNLDSIIKEETWLREFGKISTIINDEIPKLISEIESNIDVYFQNKKNLLNFFGKYNQELKKINDFMVNELPDKSDFKNRIEEFKELELNKFMKAERGLINEVLGTNTIWIE